MAEATENLSQNFDVKEKRLGLFSHLDHVLGLSRERMDKKTVSAENQQKWSRILISAVEAYGHLLNDHTLEELDERVTKLEEAKT